MQSDCVFLDTAACTCTFRRKLWGCLFCGNYLRNDGNLADKLPYLTFVATRRISGATLTVGILALLVSLASMIVSIIALSK